MAGSGELVAFLKPFVEFARSGEASSSRPGFIVDRRLRRDERFLQFLAFGFCFSHERAKQALDRFLRCKEDWVRSGQENVFLGLSPRRSERFYRRPTRARGQGRRRARRSGAAADHGPFRRLRIRRLLLHFLPHERLPPRDLHFRPGRQFRLRFREGSVAAHGARHGILRHERDGVVMGTRARGHVQADPPGFHHRGTWRWTSWTGATRAAWTCAAI